MFRTEHGRVAPARRTRRVLVCLLAAVALTASLTVITVATRPVAARADTGELVTNGTFSAGTSGGWFFPSQGGTEGCCAAPPSGYPNAYAHPDGTGTGTSLAANIVTWQNIVSPPAGSYVLSGKIRTSGGVQSAWVQADNGVFDTRYCRTTPTNATAWTSFQCSFTLSAGATVHVAMVASNLPATAWGWISFDDISLIGSGGGSGIDTAPYDLANYIIRTDGGNGPVFASTTGETMQIQYSAGRYYQVKNAQWEEISADASYIYRYRDTSPGGNNWYGLYSNGGATLGDIWMARYVSPGYSRDRTPTVKTYSKSGCGLVSSGAQTSRIVFVTFFSSWNNGGSITLTNVVQLQSQLNVNGVWTRWEDYFYGKGYGLVKFIAYNPYGAGAPQTFEGHITSLGGTSPTRETICNP